MEEREAAAWRRVAHLNMTDSSSQCPVGFRVDETAIKALHRETRCDFVLFEPTILD